MRGRSSQMDDRSRQPDGLMQDDGFVRVRGAREHNLRNVDVSIPRNALVVFTGVSGSGKSSLAFGTIYAEAQRRYLESVAPYARRLIQQVGAPVVEEISGLPPAVALQQHRGTPSSRPSVGTAATLSNSPRMLFSRAGSYPPGAPRLDSDAFSPNTAAGACPECSGLGRVHLVTEDSLVPDQSLTIREGAIAAWPGSWYGKSLRDILVELGPRRRPTLARAPAGRARLDPLHRRAAGGHRPPRPRSGPGAARLPGQVHRRPRVRAAHPGQLQEPDHAPARAALRPD